MTRSRTLKLSNIMLRFEKCCKHSFLYSLMSGKMFIFNRQFSLHLQTSKSRTLGKSPFLQKYPISLQAQTSANIKIQLAHSKYLERFRIIFLFFLSPFLVFVNLLLMKFPIPLQAQASANAELSLAHNKHLGRFQIFFFQHTL